jgi:hypothetical protein
MIAMIDNRPILQVGRHQVSCYGSAWLVAALERAAQAAELTPFPCLDEISQGILHYLETKCPLRLLPVDQLHCRVRGMLEQVGCGAIARHFEPCAPPVTVSLLAAAETAGQGFELGFFEEIRTDVSELRRLGAAAVRLVEHREAVLLVAGRQAWDRRCQRLLEELGAFLAMLGLDPAESSRLAVAA